MILRRFLHQDPVGISYLFGWRASEEAGMRIKFVTDTHIHADHVSSGRRLAEAAGADYVHSSRAEVAFSFHAAADDDVLPLGNVLGTVMHMPGHTPSTCACSSPTAPVEAAQTLPTMTVTKDPSCSCCGAWVEHVRAAGFPVDVVVSSGVTRLKSRLGVPQALFSCHTAEVGGYVIEGHVPADAIKTAPRREAAGERPRGPGHAGRFPGHGGRRRRG